MLRKLSLLLCTSVVLIGCSKNNGLDVTCSSEATKSLVSQIFIDATNKVLKNEGLPEATGQSLINELLTITTSKQDKELNKYECNAWLFLPINKDSPEGLAIQKFVSNPATASYLQNSEVTENGIKSKITYTSQMTDDGKEQLIEVSGLEGISNAAAVLQAIKNELKAKEAATVKAQDSATVKGEAIGNSNCTPNSKIIFSCIATNGKQIEVCDAGANIEYAYGKPTETPDIVVKAPRETASKSSDSAGTSFSVDIPNGNTTYSVFWGFDRMSDEHAIDAGVYVTTNNAEVATVKCAGENIVNNIENTDI